MSRDCCRICRIYGDVSQDVLNRLTAVYFYPYKCTFGFINTLTLHDYEKNDTVW
jgi:hypothetical protein